MSSDMEVWRIVVSGVVGTAVMTAYVNFRIRGLCPSLTIISLLGSMLTFKTTPDGPIPTDGEVKWVGTSAHYCVGLVFACLWYWLSNRVATLDNPVGALAFGFAAGVFGAVVWRLFFATHPKSPRIPLDIFLRAVLSSHLVFAGIVYAMLLLLGNTSQKMSSEKNAVVEITSCGGQEKLVRGFMPLTVYLQGSSTVWQVIDRGHVFWRLSYFFFWTLLI